jgi:molecular chaperone HtpG
MPATSCASKRSTTARCIENDSRAEDPHRLRQAEARTITIADNGIGMSRDEAIAHLGTIAKSGTKEFFGKLTGDQKKDAHLIGQFGVGFYSAFIVADKVTVRTRRAGLPADRGRAWECSMTGDEAGEYTVAQVDKPGRGTEITLHLREGQEDLLSSWKLRAIIRKYSDHILQPIVMKKEEWNEEQKKQVVTDEDETVNQANALWTRSKSTTSRRRVHRVLQARRPRLRGPAGVDALAVEGRHEYTQLLYVPGHAPFDMWDRNAKHGIKLYVKRVFIMDDAEKLMPPTCASCAAWSIRPTCRSTCRARSCRNPRTSTPSAPAAPRRC